MLRRIDLAGGLPVALCPPEYGVTGGSWSSEGYILFTALISGQQGVFSVPAGGGTPSPVVLTDPARGELAFSWPQVLPGGRFLYWVDASAPEAGGVYAASLAKSAERVKLLSADTRAVYVPANPSSGYLLWIRAGT
jgi:hypothetical protein